jgi:hypothetical protein
MVGTHYRVTQLATRVLGASSAADDAENAQWSKLKIDRHPRYREAKKSGFEFEFRRVRALNIALAAADFEFSAFLLLWEAHQLVARLATRAPPIPIQATFS